MPASTLSSVNDRRLTFLERLSKVQSFTLSTVIHAVLVLTLGGSVLFKAYHEPPDFAAEGGLVEDTQTIVKPPEDQPQLSQPQPSQSTPDISAVPTSPSTLAALTTTNLTTPSFQMSALAMTAPAIKSDKLSAPATPNVPSSFHGLSRDVAT